MSDRILKAVDHMPAAAKYVADGAAVSTAFGTFMSALPEWAALFSIVWLALQIYTWVERRVKNRKSKRGSSETD